MLSLGGNYCNETPHRLCFSGASISPFLFLAFIQYLMQTLCSSFCSLSHPRHRPITPSCLTVGFLPPFSPPQRCQCHRCFVSLLSESCRCRSGTSTRRVSSWLLSTRLSILAGPVTRTSSASSTGQCWSERRRGRHPHVVLSHLL